MTGDQEKMRRRDFMAGVSALSIARPPGLGISTSIKDAVAILERAVRREIAGIEEIKVSFEPDDRKRIAFLFTVVRRAPIA
jgi:hypothetical protein